MSDIQTVENTPSGDKLPTAEQFVTIVKRQLTAWDATTVEGLCSAQTEAVIVDLAPYYHTGEKDGIPETTSFKEAVSTFQVNKGREAFAELTEPEVTELVASLAPLFHEPVTAEDATGEKDGANGSDLGDLF